MVGMGRKKLSETDRHKTPRKPVQFPVDWIKVAHEEAKKRPTPAMWLLVELLHEYAKKNGRTDFPPFPWDDPPEPPPVPAPPKKKP